MHVHSAALAVGLVAVSCGGPRSVPPQVESPSAVGQGALDPKGGRTHFESVPLRSGETIQVAVTLPANYRRGEARPTLLAIGPGGQDAEAVRVGLERFWEAEALRRGVVVISPLAPDGRPYYDGGDLVIADLLAQIAQRYPIAQGQPHLAGYSFGGAAAFRIALGQPGTFASLTVLAGAPLTQAERATLGALRGMQVHMFVGSRDRGWKRRMQVVHTELLRLGVTASFTVLEGDTHQLEQLNGDGAARLFDALGLPLQVATPRDVLAP